MQIFASIKSSFNEHHTVVATNNASKQLLIPPKATGYGSSVNGGEMLLLALATCFCNDLYREAAKRSIQVSQVEVEANGSFAVEGEAGTNFSYKAKVIADASEDEIAALIRHTDTVAEIQNTLL